MYIGENSGSCLTRNRTSQSSRPQSAMKSYDSFLNLRSSTNDRPRPPNLDSSLHRYLLTPPPETWMPPIKVLILLVTQICESAIHVNLFTTTIVNLNVYGHSNGDQEHH